MKPNYSTQIKEFLSSPEATASAFSSIGWDETRHIGSHEFWCLVNYGILEEVEIMITVSKKDWLVTMTLPPILAKYEAQAEAICAALQAQYPPLIADVDVDRSILLGGLGSGDPMPTLRELWRVFDVEEVYQAVLLMCGFTAPSPDDVGFDIPDNPFDD